MLQTIGQEKIFSLPSFLNGIWEKVFCEYQGSKTKLWDAELRGATSGTLWDQRGEGLDTYEKTILTRVTEGLCHCFWIQYLVMTFSCLTLGRQTSAFTFLQVVIEPYQKAEIWKYYVFACPQA